jgi:peptide/nickel transport system permease protein
MPRFLLERLPRALVVLWGASVLTFFAMRVLPGDPAEAILGESATPQTVAALREQLGLDRPLVVQYLDWVGGAVRGDLGTSYQGGHSVGDLILAGLPVSLEILLLAQLIALSVAVPVAILSVRAPGRKFDRAASMTSFATLGLPPFLLGLLLMYLFALQLGVLPASGWVPLSEDLGGNLRTAIMPALTIAIAEVAIYMRLLRSDLLDTLQEDYVVTAMAKGVSDRRVMRRHVLRNSLHSLITVVGLNMGALIGGAVVTESVFSVPGVGRTLVEGVLNRDLPLVQGVVLFIACAYVVMNLIVDLTYTTLDPRLRHAVRT